MDAQRKVALPLLEGAGADAFVTELPVEGGRTLVCTIKRHQKQGEDGREIVQVLLSFKEAFFPQHDAGRELFLHW